MKIYVNSLHQIVALRVNDTGDDTLKEIEVPDDFLKPYCDTLIKSFCYQECQDDNGNPVVSIYPFKDFSMLMSIQEQNDIREIQRLALVKSDVDMDFRISSIEIGF